ncbi:hypothetical protein DSO57_1011651 [Entomophthora muscae]|uniref:Uncharacterized protein n=1 Tax=Entomophthora muscae TaxID=34485 RepID=A0ACC2S8I9_9FUNG|nr:hypothetical protein DSO57_1011651 [Entomophthora muscae]
MASDPLTSDASKPLLAIFKRDPALAKGFSDPAAQPALCYLDQEKIEEDQLHMIFAVNALT